MCVWRSTISLIDNIEMFYKKVKNQSLLSHNSHCQQLSVTAATNWPWQLYAATSTLWLILANLRRNQEHMGVYVIKVIGTCKHLNLNYNNDMPHTQAWTKYFQAAFRRIPFSTCAWHTCKRKASTMHSPHAKEQHQGQPCTTPQVELIKFVVSYEVTGNDHQVK